MPRVILSLLLLAAIVGGGYVYMYYDVRVQRDEQGSIQHVTLSLKGTEPIDPATVNAPQPPIRIATFNLAGLDERKLAKPKVGAVLARMLCQFDVVAVQNIHARNRGVLLELVRQINATGAKFNFAVAPEVERSEAEMYSAFLFNQARIEVDVSQGSTAYSVNSPSGELRYKPLVALFRAAGPGDEQAFTFVLVNVHTDPDKAATELALLDDLYRAIRSSHPGEDDVIILGDFGASDGDRLVTDMVPDTVSAIADTPTTLRGTRPVDNIVFNRRATTEFTGRSEVFDLRRTFDLEVREALEVSDHLLVWAEFSSYEGGQAGHVSQGFAPTTRK
ncbi:MAG: endonuclease/exonuclease/phosphatase family protein [Candidatus Nealsonbacteria bacterium]|nr:endonuclease/exonuclease/phosphatase family protein [Candidatus Nealsonbacteria bacterium]